jgi:alanyl-tRNA synthetase
MMWEFMSLFMGVNDGKRKFYIIITILANDSQYLAGKVRSLNSRELREKFLAFFRQKKHAIISSASLIPDQDPTVLFTTAGMHPLKPYLLGQPHPSGSRLANVQKCIRTVDIDNVGDATHITFFEMLGSWSLGDYFKKEAIEWSYEFLTDSQWLNLDHHKLHVTIFEGDALAPRDDESFKLWQSLGLPEERIYFLPREDNWWGPAGTTGPCGPCTEMFYDTGNPSCSPHCRPGCSCGKYFEIWNDVFMTYNKNSDGSYTLLQQHNVDTGMGIERTVSVLSEKPTVYETDTLAPLMTEIRALAQIEQEATDTQIKAMRIITDHIRAVTFIMGEDNGISPSNVEQGYVVRRLIRRAICQSYDLNIQQQFLPDLAQRVIDIYDGLYPELERNKHFIMNELEKEEQAFKKTLRMGLRKINQLIVHQEQITGKDAFILFTSFGFPIEMTQRIAGEHGLEINIEEFEKEFQRHRQLSRLSTQQKFSSGLADHSEQTTKLHTATHLLHQALRATLGSHIQQKGSNITNKRLRFDINFNRKLTSDELARVEHVVNDQITNALPVSRETMTVDAAHRIGALGFFQEQYEEQVHVYSIGEFSKEICTGPHVDNTARIGTIQIQRQRKIGATTLRLYAVITE